MKARHDPEFPNPKTFNRLGSKAQLASKIVDYCRNHKGFDDVVRLCEAIAGGNQPSKEDDSPDTEEIGFVYLLKSGRFYKIGRSNAVGRRERELAIQLPEKVDTVHMIRTDDPVGIEAYWHKRFKSKRKKGEWFELSPLDVKVFKRRKFM